MKLIFKNKKNEQLDLLHMKNMHLIEAEALNGIELEMSETDSPYIDGTSVDSVRALARGIVLTFRIDGDVQKALDVFKYYIKSKQFGTLIKTDNNGRETTINGVVKIPPYTRFGTDIDIQLEMYCNQPYWEDLDEVVDAISEIINMLYFPQEGQYFTENGRVFGIYDSNRTKVINNDGDTSVGMTIEIIATDRVVNPLIGCSTGDQYGWFMKLGSTEKPFVMEANDEVVISTHKGNKSIKFNGSNLYNGESILKYFSFGGNDWLQLEVGENEFSIDTDEIDGNVYFNILYRRRYE